MTLRINSTAPDFKAETTQGPIEFHKWIGDRVVMTITTGVVMSAGALSEY